MGLYWLTFLSVATRGDTVGANSFEHPVRVLELLRFEYSRNRAFTVLARHRWTQVLQTCAFRGLLPTVVQPAKFCEKLREARGIRDGGSWVSRKTGLKKTPTFRTVGRLKHALPYAPGDRRLKAIVCPTMSKSGESRRAKRDISVPDQPCNGFFHGFERPITWFVSQQPACLFNAAMR
jgi:hypothetical protein